MSAKIDETTKINLGLVGVIIMAVAGGATWVTMIHSDMQLIKRSLSKLEKRAGVDPTFDSQAGYSPFSDAVANETQ
jgi:hypothetical protein